jgi:hypothetical protein
MEENTFKKADANGNKLPEKIGKGINKEHLKTVMAERSLDTTNTFRSKLSDSINFELLCKNEGLNKSLVLRELMLKFTKDNS